MIPSDVQKYRTAKYEIDDMFLGRWSPRSYSDKQVPEDTLLALFEAAHWAPSSVNSQPWRFIVAKTAEERERFYSFISDYNLGWCKTAPVLTLILSRKQGSHSFDAGAAWGFLALQAYKKGLATRPMTGFDFGKARNVLGIPHEFDIEVMIAIGYQDTKEKLPQYFREREYPNDRLPVEQLIYNGKFGN